MQKHKKKSENSRQSEHDHENKIDKIEEQRAGVIGVFINNRLRVMDENIEV